MRRRVLTVLLASAMMVAGFSAPAMGHGGHGAPIGGCPTGWTLAHAEIGDRNPDRNGDGWYCLKHLNDHSDTGGNVFQSHERENHKDNNKKAL